MCGNLHTIYIIEGTEINQLASLLKKYNPKFTVYCATTIQNNSSTAIDNTIVDNSELDMSSVSPIISGLSHHNVHILTFQHVYTTKNRFTFH